MTSIDPNAVAGSIIGMDIGGSKTRGIYWRNGRVVADHSTGSANVQNVSRAEAKANIDELMTALLGGPGHPQIDQVVAGSGGVDTEADAQALTALIQPHVPHAKVSVVHDTRLLLAAGHARTGVAIIAGTGSAAWGVNTRGEQARAGGWGYLLGDEGSGYWFGREAVRHALGEMNRGLAPDQLTVALLAECGLSEPGHLIAHFHNGTSRQYWAAKSPLVFDAAAAGHAASAAMIAQAGQDLAAMGAQVAGLIEVDGPFVLGSGVGMNQPALQESFRRALAERGYTDMRVLEQDPIFGAAELAAANL